MGHIRLGQLPRTIKWRHVIELIASGADVAQVAQATYEAAESALKQVQNDKGFHEAVNILTQLGLAGDKTDPYKFLQDRGINIRDGATPIEVMCALSESLESRALRNGNASDFGDLAHRALVDAVVSRLETTVQQQTLFDQQAQQVRQSIADLRKPSEFSQLARDFYSRLTSEAMQYFLSRTLMGQAGEGQRFATTNQVRQFEDNLKQHCRESSLIMEQFSADWLSKHRYEGKGDISKADTTGFGTYALQKIRDELKRGVNDGD